MRASAGRGAWRLAVMAAAGAATVATSPQPALQLDGDVPRPPEAEHRLAGDFVGPVGAGARACEAAHWEADTWAGGWRAVRVTEAEPRWC